MIQTILGRTVVCLTPSPSRLHQRAQRNTEVTTLLFFYQPVSTITVAPLLLSNKNMNKTKIVQIEVKVDTVTNKEMKRKEVIFVTSLATVRTIKTLNRGM